jgi:hypothetical protein
MLPGVSAGLGLAGFLLIICSFAAIRRRAAFITLMVIGFVLVLAGVIVAATPAPAVLVERKTVRGFDHLNPPLKIKSSLKRKLLVSIDAPESLADSAETPESLTDTTKTPKKVSKNPEILAAVQALPPPPSPAVSWQKDSGLERVLEFNSTDMPKAINRATAVDMQAHAPRQVPAVPLRQKLGYVAASQPGNDLDAVFNPVEPPPSVGGAVYYKPAYNYPTVGEIAEERNRFWSKPETPDVDRHRRLGELRDFALTMKPQRSGAMIPIM